MSETFVSGRGWQEDFTTLEGAKKLKERIEQRWAERGKSVTVLLIQREFDTITRHCRYDIRSDMVGGQPTEARRG